MIDSIFLDYILTNGSEAGIMLVGLFILYKKTQKLQSQLHKEMSEKVESVALRANGFFDKFLDSFDFPAWVKRVHINKDGSAELRMHFLNRAYEDTFNKSRVHYVGKTDFEVWDDQIATTFYTNDLQILRTKIGLTFQEEVPSAGKMEFKKFYVFYQGSHWVVGFASPVKKEEST